MMTIDTWAHKCTSLGETDPKDHKDPPNYMDGEEYRIYLAIKVSGICTSLISLIPFQGHLYFKISE